MLSYNNVLKDLPQAKELRHIGTATAVSEWTARIIMFLVSQGADSVPAIDYMPRMFERHSTEL